MLPLAPETHLTIPRSLPLFNPLERGAQLLALGVLEEPDQAEGRDREAVGGCRGLFDVAERAVLVAAQEACLRGEAPHWQYPRFTVTLDRRPEK